MDSRETTDLLYPVVIVGAGPVGLFAATMCGILGIRACVVDTLAEVGGQCMALYPEKPIQAIPGFQNITARELISQLYDQAKAAETVFCLGNTITDIRKETDSEGRTLFRLEGEKTLRALSVIVAAGVGSFEPNRPELEHLQDFEGKSVFYHVKDPGIFAGQKVVIAGGGDAAVDWAAALSDLAESVTLLHRREQFRCTPSNFARLKQLEESALVKTFTPYQMVALEGEESQLRYLHIRSLQGAEQKLPVDKLLVLFGLSCQIGAIKNWGLALDGPKIVVDPLTCETSTPGIFAIGDIAGYPHRVNLIAFGFGEAITAAYSVRRWLFPEERVNPSCQAFKK